MKFYINEADIALHYQDEYFGVLIVSSFSTLILFKKQRQKS